MKGQCAHRKIIIAFLSILLLMLVPPENYIIFIGYISVVGIFSIYLLPLSVIIKRTLSLFPFVILLIIFLPFKKGSIPMFKWYNVIIYYEGSMLFLSILLKAWISIMILTLLYFSSPFPEIIKGFKFLGIPNIFILLTSIMYRYIYLFVDLAKKMETARKLKYFGKNRNLYIKMYASSIGLLFIKAYEKGDQIYNAMILRGFDGEENN